MLPDNRFKFLIGIIFYCLVFIPVVMWFPATARTTKFEGHIGGFQLKASNSGQTKTKSGPGAYKLAVGVELLPSIEVFAGYTIIMSSGISGDLAFGIDTGVNYFPLTPAFSVGAFSNGSHILLRPLWRPYAGFSFHQREFQSVKSSFAGFGTQIGFERTLSHQFDLKFNLRYVSLGGSQASTATELMLTTGLLFSF